MQVWRSYTHGETLTWNGNLFVIQKVMAKAYTQMNTEKRRANDVGFEDSDYLIVEEEEEDNKKLSHWIWLVGDEILWQWWQSCHATKVL